MLYELHVWGPALGLPSIDAACTASIAYLKEALLPKQWQLVIGYKSPKPLLNGTFPALRISDEWVFGYHAIVRHLNRDGYFLQGDRRNSQASISRIAQRAILATHLVNNAQPLLATHLYASHENWSTTTRTAWTCILPTHANYTVVPEILRCAKSDAARAGLATGLTDSEDAPSNASELPSAVGLDTSQPSLLFKTSKKSLHQALEAQQSAARFRIEALLDDLLEPLDLAITRGDIGQICSLDCLAYGYLAPLLTRDMPIDAIPRLFLKKYPRVVEYVEQLGERFLPQGNIDTTAAMASPMLGDASATALSSRQLPYHRVQPPSLLVAASQLVQALSRQIVTPEKQRLLWHDSDFHARLPALASAMIPAISGIILCAYRFVTFKTGPDHVFGRAKPKLAALGAAGAALSILTQPAPPASTFQA